MTDTAQPEDTDWTRTAPEILHRYHHVCVIKTGKKKYAGKSIRLTATALEPGTCYGWGTNMFDAFRDADKRRRRFQSRGYE